MKKLLSLTLAVMFSLAAMAKSQKQTVVFNVDLHCQGCIEKIQKNIAFEKGVKDLQCDLESKTAKVVFDPEKTNIPLLMDAFARIKKTATVNQEATAAATGIEVEALSGATTKQN